MSLRLYYPACEASVGVMKNRDEEEASLELGLNRDMGRTNLLWEMAENQEASLLYKTDRGKDDEDVLKGPLKDPESLTNEGKFRSPLIHVMQVLLQACRVL